MEMTHNRQNPLSVKLIFLAVFCLLIGITLLVITGEAAKKQDISSKAAVNPINVTFTGQADSSSGGQTIIIKGQTQQPLGFAQVYLTFNKSDIQVVNEITIGTPLTTVISKTNKDSANVLGQNTITVGLPPESLATPATGTFEIARIPMKLVSGKTSGTISIDTAHSYVVDLQTVEYPVAAGSYTMTTSGISPTQTASATSTPVPTGSTTPILPSTPSWWNQIPQNLRNFLEQLYVLVHFFNRPSNMEYLLEGVFPSPTP